ncbi:MAG: hypothetical protein BWY82_00826 [Verrucomicrobia bacterium ADurb.Bin474]|nr:MAG: hypothetical protein BWY82_00826 [Verrucomicrobia bacterium ADurb.Bin474]
MVLSKNGNSPIVLSDARQIIAGELSERGICILDGIGLLFLSWPIVWIPAVSLVLPYESVQFAIQDAVDILLVDAELRCQITGELPGLRLDSFEYFVFQWHTIGLLSWLQD